MNLIDWFDNEFGNEFDYIINFINNYIILINIFYNYNKIFIICIIFYRYVFENNLFIMMFNC